MIKIIYDPIGLLSHPEIKIQNISEYPMAIKNCLIGLTEGKNQTIYLVQPILLQWFKNMASRYPQGTFFFETVNARSALEKKWEMTIPTSVSNEDIHEAGLLLLEIHPLPGASFEDTILSHFFSPLLNAKTFPFTQVVALLNSFAQERVKTNLAVRLLSRTLHDRLQEWKTKARSSEQRQLIESFEDNPFGLRQQLMSFRVLRSYPSIGEALLGDSYLLLSSLKLQLQDLTVEESKIPDTVLQVTYILNSFVPTDIESMSVLIDRVSGLLSVEFDMIEKQLLLHPEWVSAALIEQVEEKFSGQSRKIAKRLAALRGLIRPAKPDLPDLTWNVDQMLSWATESYLPYQNWCNSQDHFDPELFQIGDHFSQWLMAKWDDLHANSKRMVFNILPNKAADLRRPGVINLILVIDNLGWTFSEMISGLFQERGYFLSNAEPYLAMLPSETEISKKCLLSAATGYKAIDELSYTGMLEKGWVPYFGTNAFRYISDIGSLSNIVTVDASTYVVNYLAIDKALHKSADEIGMPHREHIHHLLEKLVENVAAFIDKHSLQENIRIHVVSDHGSTRIPAEIQNDISLDYFKSDGIEARSHRYVRVSNQRFTNLPDNLKLDCFFLPANDFINQENFLCARRGNRFLATDKNTYVHGGALPEEVIVPYMVFEPISVATRDLTVLLKKNEFRYRLETIELEIGNPNDSAVEQVQVSLLNGNVESEPAKITRLNGKTNTSLSIQARFKQTPLPEEQSSLLIRVRFVAHGEQHTFTIQPKIVMKKIVEEKNSSIFDD